MDGYVWASLVTLGLFGWRTISHASFWQHLAMGRWIAEHGIPRAEPLTVVSMDRPLVYSSWLYDWMLYMLWQAGGATLITFVHVAAVVAAFFMLSRVVRIWAGPLALSYALLLCAWLLSPRFDVDPALFTLIFPALVIFTLSRATSWKRAAAVLLPAQWIWAGMHPNVLLGPLLMILYGAGVMYRARQREDSEQECTLPPRALFLLAVAALAVTCAGPYGPALLHQVINETVSPPVREWISPYAMFFTHHTMKHLMTLALALGAGGLLMQKQRLPFVLTSLAVLSAFLAVRSLIVHLEIFSLLAFPFFGISCHVLGEAARRALYRFKQIAWQSWATPACAGTLAFLIVVSINAVLSNAHYIRMGHVSGFGTGTVETAYPSRAAALLTDPTFPEPVLNVPMDGGYLAWIRPDQPAFIDQRNTFHGNDIYMLLAQAVTGVTQAWHAVEETWNPQAIVLNNAWPHTPDALRWLQARKAWRLLYVDGATTIIVKNTEASRAWLSQSDTYVQDGLGTLQAERERYEQALGKWPAPPLPASLMGGAIMLQSRGFFREAARLHELVMWGAPTMYSAALHLGTCLIQLDENEAGVRYLRKAYKHTERVPAHRLTANIQIGIGETKSGNFQQAIRYLQLASRTAPDNPAIWYWLHKAYQGAGQSADARAALERAEQLRREE